MLREGVFDISLINRNGIIQGFTKLMTLKSLNIFAKRKKIVRYVLVKI